VSGDNLFALLTDATHIVAEAVEQYNQPIWLWGNYIMSTVDRRKVFVVHGRNESVRRDLFALLRAASLDPREFSSAVVDAGGSSGFIQGIIDHAMDTAQAIVVLFCPEEHARLRDELIKAGETSEEGLQPRPNVLFEAGLALGRYPERTIVVQVGDIRPVSDLAGRHFVKLNNTTERRKDLLSRLAAAGCSVDLSGQDWLSAGDFGT
jgi:predicted nucleotide-binding protein